MNSCVYQPLSTPVSPPLSSPVTTCIITCITNTRDIPGTLVKKPICKYAHGHIFGKRATKYAQGVFYRSLSRAVTGV